jgi:hypothetical protein
MTRHLLITVAILLAFPYPAASHRLDEYLQATRIALTEDRIVLEIDLTPGVTIAPQIFALIDRNGDDRVSGPEIAAYAHTVLRDVVLELDEQPYRLTLVRAECPSWLEMRDGAGTIRLEATAQAPLGTAGRHRLVYENTHQSESSVYLVNALVPSSRAIAIAEQRRDRLQHGIHLDIDVTAPRALSPWVILQGIGLTALLAYRRRKAHEVDL